MVIAAETRTKEAIAKVALPQIRDAVTEVYLLTGAGLYELGGKAAYDMAQRIENDKAHSLLDYRHYDDDKHTWAYWVREGEDDDGKLIIAPLIFPNWQDYTSTSPQLYTKAVVFPQVIARIVGKLKQKPKTVWDKMMNPTLIIVAIVGIILIIALFMVAAGG